MWTQGVQARRKCWGPKDKSAARSTSKANVLEEMPQPVLIARGINALATVFCSQEDRNALALVEESAGCIEEVDKAFGRSGIPSFVLEGVLAELQVSANPCMGGAEGLIGHQLRTVLAWFRR